eukprot:scaffold14050_cov255-Alexandrium_tamarense.AAC.3
MEAWSYVEVASDNSNSLMTDHNGVDYVAVKGNKENAPCSNRGVCDEDTGSCRCFDTNGDVFAGSDGYGNIGDRGDCGHAVTLPISCPGETFPRSISLRISASNLAPTPFFTFYQGDPPCNDRGICDNATKRCTCEHGFTGGDCSLLLCPKGLSWFSYPSASNVGHDVEAECRSTGECLCSPGFAGKSCQFMSCGGSSDTATPCSGHGSCLTMRELALLQPTAMLTYGADPNVANTWDADVVMGCRCDEGFDGHSCSLASCLDGVDPLTGSLESCSRHGICDHDTGNCRCFRGWGSSDGNGNLGSLNDCGHRLSLRGYP